MKDTAEMLEKTKNVLRVEVTDFAIVQVNCFKYRSVHGVPRIVDTATKCDKEN